MAVQRDLRDDPGVTVLIYDQVCATEKRRRRKRGSMAQAARRVVINPRSARVAATARGHPTASRSSRWKPTFGRKRRIDPTLQRRFFLPGRLLPQLRDPGRPAVGTGHRYPLAAREQESSWPGLADPAPARRGRLARIVRGYRRRRHRDLRRDPGHGRAPGRQSGEDAGFHRPGTKERRRSGTCPDRRRRGVLDVVRIPLARPDLMLAADLAVGCQAGVLERNAKTSVVIGNLDLAAKPTSSATRAVDRRGRCTAGRSRKPPTATAPSGCMASGWPNGCSATRRR